MCWFLYHLCDRCRWPEIGAGLHLVGECDDFRNKFHADPNGQHDYGAVDPATVTPANNWNALGTFTFLQWVGTRWNIIPKRDCIKWGPIAQYHICAVCQEVLDRQIKEWQASFEDIDFSVPAPTSGTDGDQGEGPVFRAELEGDPVPSKTTDAAKELLS
ncbi:hypothetical protein CLAFUW4_03752 [Fulvia fulva]|uniref:uncharacterized protein n=1 Tax=Passalora fulva TaxID=5499 RepID=UPI0028526CED|nr:uncharacterized protein CLAFUR5_20164 [Fulvia fulva]KAK4633101.1 hypothetical protein CLAFUR0_03740 [Fulvia fulva]WMI38804.1 hypothetical protein CLAFUR5_20164 [Fulvia fulva]WPV11787.1 hypothetical protein CLAFUW4_03752 [Fulvia fulva]